ncbi:BRO-N domain-containing protein [Sporolactobacillus mangiferae]|uniref:BRO-N domain-containing protein n=1 Tax=Sporolactobacillus mangiferae TaxID=2940498 RepID=UPI003F60C44F
MRFVEKKPDEWWAVEKDIGAALDYSRTRDMNKIIDPEDKGATKVRTPGGEQTMVIISEFGIYDAIIGSHKAEVKEFKLWVKKILKELRESAGLEGFQIFHMLDKKEQNSQMKRIRESFRQPVRVDFIKANTTANKSVSTRHGCQKMIRKGDMTPDMLVDREPILAEVVDDN